MASIDMQLCSRIIRTGDMKTVLEWGISEFDMVNPQAQGLFKMLMGQYMSALSRGTVMGPAFLGAVMPNLELVDDPHMSTELLCQEVRTFRLRLQVRLAADKMLNSIEGADPLEIAAAAQAELSAVQYTGIGKKSDLHFSEGMDQLVVKYELSKSGKSGLFGFPWFAMTQESGGYQEDDYVVIYGRPKSKKSFVISYMAADAYMSHDKNVGMFTKEMTSLNMYQRVAGCCLQLDYQSLRKGRLQPEQEHDLFSFRDYVRERAEYTGGKQNLVMLSGRDMPPGRDNISWIRSKVEKYKFDIMFIDGLYLMSAEGVSAKAAVHERVSAISRAARQMQLDTGVPLVVTMQANRAAAKHNGAEFDEIAYSDSIGQDVTMAIRAIGEKTGPTIALVFAGSREFLMHGMRINGVPCSDFSYVSELTEKDIEKAKNQDQTDLDKEEIQPRKTKKVAKQVDPSLDSMEKTLRKLG